MSADLARALVASLDSDALDELAARLAPRLAHANGQRVAHLPVSVAGAAELAGVSPRTIRRALTAGQLDGQQVAGRWKTTTDALNAWRAAGGPTGAPPRPDPPRRRPRGVSGPTSAADAIRGTEFDISINNKKRAA